MLVVTILSLAVAAISVTIAWRSYRLEQLRSAARVAALGTAIDTTQEEGDRWSAAGETPLDRVYFDASTREAKPRGPLLTAAAGLVAGVVVIVVMAMLADRERSVAVAEPPASSALELLSMSHARDGSTLVVTGTVHNAARSQTAPVTTVVTALDGSGQTIASGMSTMSSLGPGTTRPFTVRVEHVGSVNRYRVSFRTDAGVLPHVDRRAPRVGAGVVAE